MRENQGGTKKDVSVGVCTFWRSACNLLIHVAAGWTLRKAKTPLVCPSFAMGGYCCQGTCFADAVVCYKVTYVSLFPLGKDQQSSASVEEVAKVSKAQLQ